MNYIPLYHAVCWEFCNYVSPLGNTADRRQRRAAHTHTLQLFRNARTSRVIQVLENFVTGNFASYGAFKSRSHVCPAAFRLFLLCSVVSLQLFSPLFPCFVASLLTTLKFNPVHIYSKRMIYSLMV